MTRKEFEELIPLKLLGQLSNEESTRFDLALKDPERKQQFDNWKEAWNSTRLFEVNDINIDAAKKNIEERIKVGEPDFTWEEKIVFPQKKYFRWQWAAVLLLVSTVGIWKMNDWHKSPAKWVATATALGETRRLTLSDGTEVLLNADTKFKFPDVFSAGVREVYLEGEAWFDVKANPEHIFLVHTGGLTTQVTGTHFNVKAFPNEDRIEVALVSGKVSVEYNYLQANGKQGKQMADLKPMQRLSHRTDGTEDVINYFQKEEVLGWKMGVLTFKDVPLIEMIEPLSRRFGVSIAIKDAQIGNCRFTTKIIDQNLEDVLASIEFSHGIKFETNSLVSGQGKKYLLTGKGCNMNN